MHLFSVTTKGRGLFTLEGGVTKGTVKRHGAVKERFFFFLFFFFLFFPCVPQALGVPSFGRVQNSRKEDSFARRQEDREKVRKQTKTKGNKEKRKKGWN